MEYIYHSLSIIIYLFPLEWGQESVFNALMNLS